MIRTIKQIVMKQEDTFRWNGSLRRLLATTRVEPLSVKNISTIVSFKYDLIDALELAMRRSIYIYDENGLRRRAFRNRNDPHPADAVWPAIRDAFANLVVQENCGEGSFSVKRIDELNASKATNVRNFPSMDDLGRYVSEECADVRCETAAEFSDAIHHSFDTRGEPYRIEYRSWTNHYRWVNHDGSHHAAAARAYALINTVEFSFRASFRSYSLNSEALATLRASFRGFLLSHKDVVFTNELARFEVAFQTITLHLEGESRDILLIWNAPHGRERIVIDELMRQLGDSGGELIAVLSRAEANQQRADWNEDVSVI
jgi:hypothetical protein